MSLIVRIARPEDAPALDRVFLSSYATLWAPAYDAEVLARALPFVTRANPKLLSSGTFYLCEAPDGGVVGAGGFSLDRPGSGEIASGVAHVRHFATLPEWTGRGVGRALYGRCERDAQARGVEVFECNAALNAVPFYAAMGFDTVGETSVPLGPAVAMRAMVMRKVLGPPGGTPPVPRG
ncbi:MAG: GNAT family N-acetyltransferase [Hyphomicrobiales bacterium]